MGSRVQTPRNKFGLIWSKLNPWVWSLPWTLALHLGSPNHKLSFWALCLGPNRLILPSKMVPCGFSHFLPLFGLGPSSIGHGSNLLWLSPNRIALFHWTLDFRPSSKVALSSLDEPQLSHHQGSTWVTFCWSPWVVHTSSGS
jgi:hypothetical protein